MAKATPNPAPSPSPSPPTASSTPQSLDPSQSINIRKHSPVPLTAGQEAEVRELYYKRVRQKCAEEIKAFATCCTGRTFSISWACRAQRQAMNTCMNSYATRAEEDAAREEWFAKIPERAREKEETEKKRLEERQKWREWWGIDEQGRKIPKDELAARRAKGVGVDGSLEDG